MIYIDDHIDDFDLQEALATVSAQRREQALRYRHERDRRLNVAAYRLLHRSLMTEYGINELPKDWILIEDDSIYKEMRFIPYCDFRSTEGFDAFKDLRPVQRGGRRTRHER